ncbi:putative Ig domain-containing protein [Cellvibrio sp. UBA7661]|uniref:putative Ig domain-containing protein n=1 Tax=Cellvibrio sp. UBA7661 TaxID=1946311 RepID=UPI002F35381A
MSKLPRHRRPLIEALEPRLLFSATADIAVFDDGNSDAQYLAQAAEQVDLASIYLQDQPLMMASQNDTSDVAPFDQPSESEHGITSVVFVDMAVSDYEAIVDDIKSRSDADKIAVIYLDPQTDGVEQIASALAQYSNLSAVHIISHGSAGAVELGNTRLTDSTLFQYEDDLAAWGKALGETGDILLYGCDVVAYPTGQALIERMAQLTDADVAASDDTTGHKTLGGDWDLEYRSGEIDTALLVSAAAQEQWVKAMATSNWINIQGGTNAQTVSSTTGVGQSFLYDSPDATYLVNQLSVQLRLEPGAANQDITIQLLDEGWNDVTPLVNQTFNSNALDGTFGWYTVNFGNVSLNDGQTYIVKITTNNADGKVSVAYRSDAWNNSEMIVNGVGDSANDLNILVSHNDGNNQAPVNTVPGAQSTNQNTPLIFSNLYGNRIQIADADAFPNDVEVTLTSGQGSLTLGQTTGLKFTSNDGFEDYHMVFRGSVSEVNAALATITYTPSNGFTGNDTISITTKDLGLGGGLQDQDNISISVNNTNDAPVATITEASYSVNEQALLDLHGTGIVVNDSDGDTLTVTISAPLALSQLTAAVGTTGVVISSGNGTNSLVLTGTSTQLNNLFIGNNGGTLTYRYSGDAPPATETLTVSASDGSLSANDSATINITGVNDAPTVANPISDQTTAEESFFSFQFADNTFSDVDPGATFTYSATRADGNPLPSWLSFNAATRTFSGVPDDGDVGTISIKVTASDGNGGTAEDTFDLTVTNVNDAPFVNSPVGNQNATEDSAFNYTFPANTFGDGDLGASFTYTAELAGGGALPGWLNFDSATRTFSGTPANGDVGTISVKLTVNDGAGGTASDTFDIVVANTNDAPTVANPILDQTATENALFNYTFPINVFNDQDVGNTLTYTAQIPGGAPLPAWLSFDSATRTFSGTPSNGDVGTISIEVIASDGTASVSDTFDIVIGNTDDSPDLVTPIPNQNATEDVAFNFQFPDTTFNDPDVGDTLTYTATMADGSALPGWLSFNATTRTFSGTPANADVGTISIKVTADDGNGGTPATDTFDIVIANSNDAPTIATAISNQNATEDSAFNFTFAANTFADQDVGDSLTYTAQLAGGGPLPAWLNFDSATRTFSGTPTNAHVGSVSIDVIADDGNGGTVTDTFTITVANTNDAPTVANIIPNQNATEDAAFNFQFAANTFADVDAGATLTYSAELNGGGGLPTWLSFDSATRTFSGTPANSDVGTITIDVTADDGNGGTVSDTFTITVANTNDAPTVANIIPNQNATEDAAFNFQFAANTFADVDAGATLTYSAQLNGGGGLPAWLNFDSATRTFSGTPTNSDVGTLTIDVTANDGNGGAVTDTFTITVANTNDAPTVVITLTDYYADEQTWIDLHGTGISVADVDSSALTITITGAGSNSNLAATVGTTGVNIVSGINTDTLILSGTAAQLNDLFAGNNGGTLTYRLSGDTPLATRLLTISASDGSLSGNDTATINITAVNDAPENDVPGAQVTSEDTALVFSLVNGNRIQVDDLDVGGGNLEITLSVTNGTLTLAGTSGLSFTTGDGTTDSTLVFTGTKSDINTALATLTFNPTSNYNGAAVLSLTTSDLGNTGTGGTLTDTDTVNITINAANDAPTVANIIPNQNATEDAAFNFQFAANTFADVDAGATLTYSVQLNGGGGLPTWLSFDSATRTFSGTPANSDVGTLTIDVTADDGNGGTVTDTFTLTVANVNDAPTVANIIPDQNATEDAAFNFQFAANTFADVDAGATLTYSAQLNGGGGLPAWLSFDPVTRTFSGTPANSDVGTLMIDVTADDGNGGTVTDTFTLTVANVNDAPTVANIIPNQNATEDAAFNFQFASNTFADVELDSLTYSAQLNGGGGLPAWLSFDSATRTFSGTPANGDVGTLTIDVTADDGNGGTVTDTFTLTVANVNDAPTVANIIPDQNATEDAAFNFQFAANTFADVDAGATLTYSAELNGGGGLPAWLSFNSATRTFSGTPANSDVGTITIDVTADDGNGGTVTDTFTITIANTNDAPTVANIIPNQNATEDAAFNFQFASNTFADAELDSLTYSAQLNGGGGLPTWLSFDSATRTFSGTPANSDVGTLTIDVTANDGNGGTVTDTFTITVANTNDAPTVATPIPDRTATEASAFNFQFNAGTFVDADAGDTLTYSAQLNGGGGLPAWLSFDPATRTFSGVPGVGDIGTLTIDVTAEDSTGATVTDTFTLTVNPVGDLEYIDTGNGTTQLPLSPTPIGQSFFYNSVGATYTVNEVGLYLARFADAAVQTITVELRDGWNGAVLGTASISSTQISSDGFGWHTFSFANVALNDSQTYVIQVSSSGTDDKVLFSRLPGDVFPDGTFIDNGVPDAAGWDLVFKIAKDDGTNTAPIVDYPINDQTIDAEDPFNLVVPLNTFSDPDPNDTITYRAQLAGGGSMGWLQFNESTRTFWGTPHWNQAGTITVELIATDNHGTSTSDFFDITVVNTNIAPTVNQAIPNQTVNEDSVWSFQFDSNTFADVDAGQTFTYTAELATLGGMPPWLSFDAATRTFSGTPANGDVGTWTVEVTANDGFGGEVVETFDIVVANTNDAPVVASPIPDQSATETLPFTFTFNNAAFSDEDVGDVLTYTATSNGGALPGWLNFNSATRTFSGTPPVGTVGALNIEVAADDGTGGLISDSFVITIAPQPPNVLPVVQNPIADQSVEENQAFGFTIPASTFVDADGDTLSYSAQLSGGGALPSWLVFDAATGTFSGTPSASDIGSITVQVTATDSRNGSVSDSFVITINNLNDAPVLAIAPADQAAVANSPFSVTFPANMFTDADAGTVLTYTATQADGSPLPDWLVFSSSTLNFSGTPSNADEGSIAIQIVASDGIATATANFRLSVTAVNEAPQTSGTVVINNLEDAAGDQVDLWAMFSDAETASRDLVYSLLGNSNPALVTNASIDPATGKLQLNYGANQFGSCDLVVRAQDAQGAWVDNRVSIIIEPVNDAPVSTGIADIRVAAGSSPQQMNLGNVFSDIENGTNLVWSLVDNTNSAVATSVQIDPLTGVMTLSFAPATGGESTITLRAQDADGAWVDTRFKVIVAGSPVTPPVVPPVTPPVIEPPVTPPPPTTPPVVNPPTTPPTTPPSTEVPGTNPVPDAGGSGGDGGSGILTPPGLPGNGQALVVDSLDTEPRSDAGFDDKSSRDIERAQEMFKADATPVTTLTASTALAGLIAPDSGFAPWEEADFDSEVRRLRAQMDEAMEEEQDRRAIVAGITFSITTGLLVWSLRASSLLLTMMSMLPLWRGLDPLPILDEVNKRKKELEQQRKDREREDKSSKEVGYLFDHAQRKEPGP